MIKKNQIEEPGIKLKLEVYFNFPYVKFLTRLKKLYFRKTQKGHRIWFYLNIFHFQDFLFDYV